MTLGARTRSSVDAALHSCFPRVILSLMCLWALLTPGALAAPHQVVPPRPAHPSISWLLDHGTKEEIVAWCQAAYRRAGAPFEATWTLAEQSDALNPFYAIGENAIVLPPFPGTARQAITMFQGLSLGATHGRLSWRDVSTSEADILERYRTGMLFALFHEMGHYFRAEAKLLHPQYWEPGDNYREESIADALATAFLNEAERQDPAFKARWNRYCFAMKRLSAAIAPEDLASITPGHVQEWHNAHYHAWMLKRDWFPQFMWIYSDRMLRYHQDPHFPTPKVLVRRYIREPAAGVRADIRLTPGAGPLRLTPVSGVPPGAFQYPNGRCWTTGIVSCAYAGGQWYVSTPQAVWRLDGAAARLVLALPEQTEGDHASQPMLTADSRGHLRFIYDGKVWDLDPEGAATNITLGDFAPLAGKNGVCPLALDPEGHIFLALNECAAALPWWADPPPSPAAMKTTLAELAPDGTLIRKLTVPGWVGGLAWKAPGMLYATLPQDGTVIRITPDNGRVVLVAGLPGRCGHADKRAGAARFGLPSGIAVAPDGSIIIADIYDHAIRRIDGNGAVTTVVGVWRGQKAGRPAGGAAIALPATVAVSPAGEILFTQFAGDTLGRIALATGRPRNHLTGPGGMPARPTKKPL